MFLSLRLHPPPLLRLLFLLSYLIPPQTLIKTTRLDMLWKQPDRKHRVLVLLSNYKVPLIK